MKYSECVRSSVIKQDSLELNTTCKYKKHIPAKCSMMFLVLSVYDVTTCVFCVSSCNKTMYFWEHINFL